MKKIIMANFGKKQRQILDLFGGVNMIQIYTGAGIKSCHSGIVLEFPRYISRLVRMPKSLHISYEGDDSYKIESRGKDGVKILNNIRSYNLLLETKRMTRYKL